MSWERRERRIGFAVAFALGAMPMSMVLIVMGAPVPIAVIPIAIVLLVAASWCVWMIACIYAELEDEQFAVVSVIILLWGAARFGPLGAIMALSVALGVRWAIRAWERN